MNIVWVEDFGGDLEAGDSTLRLLFKGLIKNEVFNHWGNEDDLLSEPEILTTFFEKHSNHKVVLLKNVFDYQDRVAQDDLTKHDVFVIDINLTKGVDPGRSLPPSMEKIDRNEFHQKAGFYIYNHLVRSGVPPDNICFLTGEKESTLGEFEGHCLSSLMPTPEAFEKSDNSGYPEFRAWLNGHQEDSYLSLRRAVIEGCEYLKKLVAEDKSAIQFGDFIRPERSEPSREITPEDMRDYLDSLQQLLPARKPSDAEKKRLFRLFVRSLAHEWEEQAKPQNVGGRDHRSTLGWIMKNVRNWMSHNSVINHLSEADVAFLFLVNMRAMFRWDFKPAKFEEQLLCLIDGGKEKRLLELDESALQKSLVKSYKKTRELVQEQSAGESRHFAMMVNNLARAGVDGTKIDYVRALYQMFWHGLVRADISSAREGEKTKNGRQEHFLQMFCNFTFDTGRFRAAPGKQDDFLQQLACAIYPRSFQE